MKLSIESIQLLNSLRATLASSLSVYKQSSKRLKRAAHQLLKQGYISPVPSDDWKERRYKVEQEKVVSFYFQNFDWLNDNRLF